MTKKEIKAIRSRVDVVAKELNKLLRDVDRLVMRDDIDALRDYNAASKLIMHAQKKFARVAEF